MLFWQVRVRSTFLPGNPILLTVELVVPRLRPTTWATYRISGLLPRLVSNSGTPLMVTVLARVKLCWNYFDAHN